jgi:hypothetical protein
MRVEQSEQAAALAARSGLASTPVAAPRTSFADALAKSSATRGAAAGATKAEQSDALPKGPKAETTRQVPGHDYVEVMSGPRNGMFINTSDNERRGEAFVRVRRDDRDLHIYGSGKDRRVITVMHESKGPERTRKVENHDYVEIVSGARNGMFINMTDNERRGEAFVLVKKSDHDLHIYGSGRDRRVIIDYNHPVGSDKRAADKKAGAEESTGGVTAPAS